jgi:hypothetical protein
MAVCLFVSLLLASSFCASVSVCISRSLRPSLLLLPAGPWNVVAFTAVGAYMGSNWSRWEDNIYEKVNDKRISVGYKPIVRKESP